MELYRGSRKKTHTIKAQEVLPIDFSKFKGTIPTKAIWATQYKDMAWVFGIFWQRMSIKINTTYRNKNLVHEVQIVRELYPEELEEQVYLYTMDGSSFQCVGGRGSEWYSLEDQLDATVETRKIKDILNELLSSNRIIITINRTLETPNKK